MVYNDESFLADYMDYLVDYMDYLVDYEDSMLHGQNFFLLIT